MKRFPSLLLAALVAACSFAHSAAAESQVAPKRVRVKWTNFLAAAPNGGRVDSLSLNYSSAAQRVDTTAAIFIGDAVLPPAVAATSAVNDSIGWARFSLFPENNSITVGADSLYVGTQVSENGINWIDLTPTWTFSAEGLLGNNIGAVVLETASSNCFVMPIRQAWAGVASGFYTPVTGLTATKTTLQAYGYTYIRFIVQADITGKYVGDFRYFSNLPE